MLQIQDLLGQVSPQEFMQGYFQKQSLILKHQNPRLFKDVLTLDMLDDILYSVNFKAPELRLVNHALSENPKTSEYTYADNSFIDPDKFSAAYLEGCTLVFTGLQNHLGSLRTLVSEIGDFFKLGCQTNIYVTPPGAQGFRSHYDTHDVIVLQFAGKKKWRLFETYRPHANRSMPFEESRDDPGAIEQEFTLQTGDVLYIPKGKMHEAISHDDDMSGHITFGLVGDTWLEILQKELANRSRDEAVLRKYAYGAFGGESQQADLQQIVQVLQGILADVASEAHHEERYAKIKFKRSPGFFKDVVKGKNQSIGVDRPVSLRNGGDLELLEEADRTVTLKYYDTELNMPKEAKPMLEALSRIEEPKLLKELDPSLDQVSQANVATMLFQQGILRVH